MVYIQSHDCHDSWLFNIGYAPCDTVWRWGMVGHGAIMTAMTAIWPSMTAIWLPYSMRLQGSNSQIKRTLEPSSACVSLTHFDDKRSDKLRIDCRQFLQLSHGLNWLNTVERHASSCWFACYCSPQSLSKVRFVSKCLEISWNVLNLQSTDQSTLFLLCFVMNAKWCTSASAARPVGSCGGRATGSRCPCVKRNVPGVTVALPHQNMSKTKLLYSTTILPSFYKNVFWKILSSLSSSSTLFLQIQLSGNVPCLVSSPHKVKTNDSMITQWRKLDYESRNLWMTYAKNNMERMKELTRDREKGLSCTSLSQEKASLCTSDQLACFPIY